MSKTNLIIPPRGKMIEELEGHPLCLDFLAGLKATTSIDFLCLSGNSYSALFFQQLAPYLAKMTRITRVVLADIFTTRKNDIIPALQVLSSCLQNKQIVLFDLSSNAICPDGCEAIQDVLKTNPTLKHLILNHIALSEKGTVTITKAIEEGGLSLRVLRVIKNRIENEAARFSQMLGHMLDLEELIIFQNSIKHDGMTALLAALQKNRHLRVLDIGDNHISDVHAEMLAEIIRSHERLRVLRIDDCNISKKGSRIIFQALEETAFKNLEEFSYDYNEFDSVNGLLKALQDYNRLRAIRCKGADDTNDVSIQTGLKVEFESDDEDYEEEEETPHDFEITLPEEMGAHFHGDDWKHFNPAEKATMQKMLDDLKRFAF
jgi:Ran GTPase-activating protein (RanGAP) involved in mRNA processing and transport